MTIIITFDRMIPGVSSSLSSRNKGVGVIPHTPGMPTGILLILSSLPVSHHLSGFSCSTGNEGVINPENDHLKGSRHENHLSG
ncbi:MAG TPA: hypothetical protein PLG75_05255 [Methanoculleus sp.]|nr:hypothetical protein [Methanoculleus sp.]